MGSTELRLDRLVMCEHFSGTQWQLPTEDALGERMLIGWQVEPRTRDGDVPPPVARLLSDVLCHYTTVTFPTAMGAPAPSGLLTRKRSPARHFQWVSASDASDAEQLFFADGFSWSSQAQVAILSAVKAPIAALSERYLGLLADPDLFAELRNDGALGIVLPGVDGRVAGIYAFSPKLAGDLRGDLAAEATKTGTEYVTTNEEAFAGLLRS